MHPESHALFLPVFSRIEALLQAQSNVLVAIDGRCGSGKSTLAEHLQQHWHSRLLHMDDFYLPFPERAPNWASIPCGNMDFSRFLREALLPARPRRRQFPILPRTLASLGRALFRPLRDCQQRLCRDQNITFQSPCIRQSPPF